MKVSDIEKQIAELQKKKERMLKQREYQRNFQNKKKGGNMFSVELKAEGDGKICEVATLQEALEEIKHQFKMGLFESDDTYIIRKNNEVIAEYSYEQAKDLTLAK